MQGKELEITRLFLEKQTEGTRHCDYYPIDPLRLLVTVGAAGREKRRERDKDSLNQSMGGKEYERQLTALFVNFHMQRY